MLQKILLILQAARCPSIRGDEAAGSELLLATRARQITLPRCLNKDAVRREVKLGVLLRLP